MTIEPPPLPSQSPASTAPPPLPPQYQYPCPRCRGELVYQVESPNSGTGCIIVILGLILAPFIIGIPIVIYGFVQMGKKKRYWHCRSCGTVYPAATG
jgi:hypothetical protein